jgi:hypothetical protein
VKNNYGIPQGPTVQLSLNLEKDSIYDTYFPYVEVGARRNEGQDAMNISSHSVLSSGTTDKSVAEWKVLESTFNGEKAEIVSRGKDGLGPSSRKWSRTTQRAGISIEPTDETEGEKQQIAWEQGDTMLNTKKGRKIQVSPTNVPRAKAVAAGQPHHHQ